MNNYFTVKPAPQLKPNFYKKTAKDVNKALSNFLSSIHKASIKDDSDWSGGMMVELSLGKLDSEGSKDKTPWVDASCVTKLIEKMKLIGWTMTHINVKKKHLSIGFAQTVKASNYV